MKKVRKAIIPAAGMGTRFLPATKAMPKEMLPIVDKPTIQFIVEEAIASGIEDIIIVTGKGKRAIEDHFDNAMELETSLIEKGKLEMLEKVQESSNVEIHYIRQKEPLGLGHAIWCARKFIGDEPFAVLLGDDIVQSEVPCLKQLISQYENNITMKKNQIKRPNINFLLNKDLFFKHYEVLTHALSTNRMFSRKFFINRIESKVPKVKKK